MLILSTTLLAIVAILLVGVIFLQKPQDEGSAHTLNNARTSSVTHIPDFLEHITHVLIMVFVGLILSTSYLITRNHRSRTQSGTIDKVEAYVLDEGKPASQEEAL